MTGGTDTSSVMVEWAMAELLRHLDVLKKAQDELDAVDLWRKLTSQV